MYAFAAPADIGVYPGATKPLIRPARHDPEIHGLDGLGGVDGLPSTECEGVRARVEPQGQHIRAIEGIANAVRNTWKQGAGEKLVLISSGPMTNIALFVSVYPDLLDGIGKGITSRLTSFNSHDNSGICLHGRWDWHGKPRRFCW